MDAMREDERVRMAQNTIIVLSDEESDSGRREIPITSYQFIQNLKREPNMVHELSRQIKISLKKQRLENSVKHQIHQIIHITSISIYS